MGRSAALSPISAIAFNGILSLEAICLMISFLLSMVTLILTLPVSCPLLISSWLAMASSQPSCLAARSAMRDSPALRITVLILELWSWVKVSFVPVRYGIESRIVCIL